MMNHNQIQNFLNDVKRADTIDFINTEKNRKTRMKLGLSILDCEYIIENLTVSDYHQGPLIDKNPNKQGEVWIFKAKYKNSILYIKLKETIIIRGKSIVKCLSCHIDNM